MHLLHRTGELGGKKHFLVFRPARGIAETRHQGRTLDLHSALAHLVPAYALVQIEHHEAILGVGRQCVTVHTGPLGGCQFHMNMVVEHHTVVAGAHPLGTMREQHLSLFLIQYGQESHIAQFANTRSTEVHVAKTDDHTVGLMVARAPVPSAGMLVRSQLNHAKRHIGTHKHMSVATGSYSGIHQLGQIPGHARQGHQHERQQKQPPATFFCSHCFFVLIVNVLFFFSC